MSRYLLIAFLFLLCSSKQPNQVSSVGSSLKTVTVFRTGAEMEHLAIASLKSGDNELVIEGISSYLDINSIQVKCPAAVTILGVEFNNNYLGEENISPAVKILKDSLEHVNLDIEKNNILINTSTELLDVLRSNRDIKGTQAGLSVAELTKLMNYYKAKSIEVQTDLITLREKRTKLGNIAEKIRTQIGEEQKKNTKSGGRITLQLSVALAGSYDFDISYITQNAFWTPYYDIKSDNIKSPLKFSYKAKISQTTGIDWKKVKLSLSTASPKSFGNAPVLKTWFLSYIDPVNVMTKELEKSNTITSNNNRYQYDMAPGVSSDIRLRGTTAISSAEPLYIVNGTIMSSSDFSKLNKDNIKSIEVLQSDKATAIYGSRAKDGAIVITLKEGLEDYISVTQNELDITYDISLPYDVPTNGKPQIATLKETSVPAIYKYYAVPRLDKDAYLLAEIPDWQALNLLPGEANIILEGTYIGKSFIDPSNTSDTLNLTLGTDKRVVIKKEKVTDFSSVKFLGSNKLQTITYDITVRNNKNEPINLILKDQYPISMNKEIEVKLLDSDNGTINEEIGVITWQLNIPAGKNAKHRISYSVKYPKGKVVNVN